MQIGGEHWPALVVIGKNQEQQLRAIQVIYLDPATANKAPLKVAKLTFGMPSMDTFGVLIDQGQDNTKIAFAEGPENALSIREARPDLTIYTTLGTSNFKRVPLSKETREVLICADNDGPKSGSGQQLKGDVKFYAGRGVDVYTAMPLEVKTDFNDVLKKHGVATINGLLENAKKAAKALTQEECIKRINQAQQRLQTFSLKSPASYRYEENNNDTTITAKLFSNPALLKQLEAALTVGNNVGIKAVVEKLQQKPPTDPYANNSQQQNF